MSKSSLQKTKSQNKAFTIDARALLVLGRESIKDHTTALLELVKNSYDADATKVEIEIYCNTAKSRRIRIADNGSGMTERDVDKNWLRIGFSGKRRQKRSQLNRRRTGEKGIGRISADRLGASLELRTKAAGKPVFGMKIQWDAFDVDDKQISDIPIGIIKNPSIQVPNGGVDEERSSGTELIIEALRQAWTKEDLEILREELAAFLSPFSEVHNFEVFVSTDVAEGLSGQVTSPFGQVADVELKASYKGNDLTYTIRSREQIKENLRGAHRDIPIKQLIHQVVSPGQGEIAEKLECGPTEVILLFYLREGQSLEGSGLRLADLRSFLDRNAGVKIYRDHVFVKPYGNPRDPEGDWLGLAERKTREPAAVSRPTYRVSANQVVGAVFVGRDSNPKLIDSSAREGLIKGEGFHDLRRLVLGCVHLLEAYRHEAALIEKKDDPKQDSSTTFRSLSRDLDVLKRDLSTIGKHVPSAAQAPVREAITKVESVSKQAEAFREELISQARVYRGLSTIGIAAAVFAHETQTSISGLVGATYTASNLLRRASPDLDAAGEELDKAKRYADQLSAWGAFALARVQGDKRKFRKANITEVAQSILKDVKPVFSSINIDLQEQLQPITGRIFVMDVEGVLLNLLTNAYTACQHENRKRQVRVEIKKKRASGRDGFDIVVSDTGPGVSRNLKEKIWTPLFSTKTDQSGKQIGTGLGLAIVDSIVDELHGEKEVDADPILKGARFRVWLPLA